MKTFLIRFKVIDHWSDRCADIEQTYIKGENIKDVLDEFYREFLGETVWLESVEEATWM